MFCPDCGSENARAQKFCNRCGANLLVVEQARSIISEVATPGAVDGLSASAILKIVTAICIVGIFIITGGAVALSAMQSDLGHTPPVGLFFALGGFTVLWLIVRRLLGLINQSPSRISSIVKTVGSTVTGAIAEAKPKALADSSTQPIYSVTEERTRQFEK